MNGTIWEGSLEYANHPQIRAALFDIDGTLTTGGEVWAILLASPRVPAWRKAWLYLTAYPHYVLARLHLADQAAFRDRWIRLMAWLITGWSEDEYLALCERMVQETLLPALRDDVVSLLRQHHTTGHVVLLVSTMFAGIVTAMARAIGADAGLGSQVGLSDGRCTGRIVGDTCAGARKLEFVGRHLEKHHADITLSVCAAYADSASDVPFLSGVRFPVATYPDAAMRQAAVERGWTIFPG